MPLTASCYLNKSRSHRRKAAENCRKGSQLVQAVIGMCADIPKDKADHVKISATPQKNEKNEFSCEK